MTMCCERTGTFILWAARRVLVFVIKQQSSELEGLTMTLRAGSGARGQGSGWEAAHLGSGEGC